MRAGQDSAGHAGEGYALLALLATSAVLLAGLAVAIPRLAQQSQRVKDERLIQHGEQYRRAIELYFREHKKYPKDLDDLEDTNGVRYLRRRYPDPMGEAGEWRLIHMGTDGRFEDSLLFDTARDVPAGALGRTAGSVTGAGLAGLAESQAVQGAGSLPGVPGAPDSPDPFLAQVPARPERFRAVRESAAPDLAVATRYSQGFEFNPAGDESPPDPGQPPDYSRMLPSQVPMNENARPYAPQDPAAGMGASTPAPQPGMPPRPGAPQPGRGAAAGSRLGGPVEGASVSGATGMINQLLTSPRPGGIAGPDSATQAVAAVPRFERGIAGVASQSEATGVKVYNGRQAYNEWEFVYDYRDNSGASAVAGAVPPAPPSQRGNRQPSRQRSARQQRGRPVR